MAGNDLSGPVVERSVAREAVGLAGKIASSTGKSLFRKARKEITRLASPDVFFAEEFIRRYRSLRKYNLTDEQIARTLLASARETIKNIGGIQGQSTK